MPSHDQPLIVRADYQDDSAFDDFEGLQITPGFARALEIGAWFLGALFTLFSAVGAVTIGRWLAEWSV